MKLACRNTGSPVPDPMWLRARPRPGRPSLPTLLAVLAVLATLAAAPAVRAQDPGVTLQAALGDTLPINAPGLITGLTWVGGDTLAVLTEIPDSLSESGNREVRLLLENAQGMILRSEDFSGVLDRGLAWDGEFFWGCGDSDDGRSLLYKIEPDTLQVEEAFDTPGHRPSGLCWDGRFVWITDRDSGRVDRFDPEVKEITRSVVTPGFSPFGIAWDGTYMWLTDSGTGRLYRLAGGRRRWTGTVDAGVFLFRDQDVRLLFDGQDLRYLTPGRNLAIQILLF